MKKLVLSLLAMVSISQLATAQSNVTNDNAKNSALEQTQLFAIGVSVPDLVKATEWYTNVLGFKKVGEFDFTKQTGNHIVILSKNDYLFELIKAEKSIKSQIRNTPPEHYNVQGITQATISVKDINAVVSELSTKGVAIIGKIYENKEMRISYGWISDPFGNLIQLLQK
jgi:catechol 2,3-dioxygenase-like lactoylglutathione lyase family enzyme